MGLIVSLLKRWSALAKERWTLQKNVTIFWFSVLLLHELEQTSTMPWATCPVRKATLYYLTLIEPYKWLWEGILKIATVCDWSYISYPPMQYLHIKLGSSGKEPHAAFVFLQHRLQMENMFWISCFESFHPLFFVFSGGKPAILVVMHHTFNKDYAVGESWRQVDNPHVRLTVDCLFHENKLLKSNQNEIMWHDVKKFLRVPPTQVSDWSNTRLIISKGLSLWLISFIPSFRCLPVRTSSSVSMTVIFLLFNLISFF